MQKTIKRFLLFLIGINLLAIGIILNTRSDLGVAAFTSFFYALSKITGISLGNSSIIVYFVLILFQFLLLRRLDISVLLQIPFSVVFGMVTDFYDYIIPEGEFAFIGKLLLLAVAIVLTSIGVYLYTNCRLLMTPVEGMVQTMADKWNLRFSLVKNCFDFSMLLLTILVCLFLKQPIYGIGIGTIVSALLLGRIIGVYEKYFSVFFASVFESQREKMKNKWNGLAS